MSDDTPTERFDPNAPDPKNTASNVGGAPSDDAGDAPTRRLDQTGGDAPTERFAGPAGNDAPTERFATMSGGPESAPLSPARVPQAARPVLAEPSGSFGVSLVDAEYRSTQFIPKICPSAQSQSALMVKNACLMPERPICRSTPAPSCRYIAHTNNGC